MLTWVAVLGRMKAETLFLAVSYLDRFLSAVLVDRELLQLVSASLSLSISLSLSLSLSLSFSLSLSLSLSQSLSLSLSLSHTHTHTHGGQAAVAGVLLASKHEEVAPQSVQNLVRGVETSLAGREGGVLLQDSDGALRDIGWTCVDDSDGSSRDSDGFII